MVNPQESSTHAHTHSKKPIKPSSPRLYPPNLSRRLAEEFIQLSLTDNSVYYVVRPFVQHLAFMLPFMAPFHELQDCPRKAHPLRVTTI